MYEVPESNSFAFRRVLTPWRCSLALQLTARMEGELCVCVCVCCCSERSSPARANTTYCANVQEKGAATQNLFLLGFRLKLKPTAHFQKLLLFQGVSSQGGCKRVPGFLQRRGLRSQGSQAGPGSLVCCWECLGQSAPDPWAHCGEGSREPAGLGPVLVPKRTQA